MRSFAKYIILIVVAFIFNNCPLYDCGKSQQPQSDISSFAPSSDTPLEEQSFHQLSRFHHLAYCKIGRQENNTFKSSKDHENKGHKTCEFRHIKRHNNYSTYSLQSPPTPVRAVDKYVYAFRHIII